MVPYNFLRRYYHHLSAANTSELAFQILAAPSAQSTLGARELVFACGRFFLSFMFRRFQSRFQIELPPSSCEFFVKKIKRATLDHVVRHMLTRLLATRLAS